MVKVLTKYMAFPLLIIFFGGFMCYGGLEMPKENVGALDSSFPYSNGLTNTLKCDSNTDLGNCTSIKKDSEGQESIIIRLLSVFGLDTDDNKDLKFIDYAKAILNMALGLISFIALVMTIYTFYMMFFTDNEDKIKKAKGNLVGIFIALGIIGLAWIIVSFIFWWFQSNWKDNEENLSPAMNNMSLNYTNENKDNQIYLII